MTSATSIGRVGQKALEGWAAQVSITANPSLHDERGWDALLQLPRAGGDVALRGPLDRAAPEISCMVQVKTTTRTEQSEPISLSNWQRMCTEPIPWFVLAIHLDEDLSADRAYLVHVDEEWCERVLRRLRELDPTADLADRTINVTWAESHLLTELHGRELLRLIRQHVTQDQRAYVGRKLRWFDELGYEDRARRVAVQITTPDPSVLYVEMADLAVGLRSTLPGDWTAEVSDVRFGIERPIKGFGRESGEMEFRANGQGHALLEVCSSASRAAVQAEIYHASSVFPFIPPEFDKVRLVAPHLSCVINPVQEGERRGFSAAFAFAFERDRELRIDTLKAPIGFIRTLAAHAHHPLSLRIQTVAGVSEFSPAGLATLDPEGVEFVALVDRAISICEAFELPPSTALVLGDVEDQKAAVVFMSSILDGKDGRLEAPHRGAIDVGSMFGVTTECAVDLLDRTLACFVGAHGHVTSCTQIPGTDYFRIVVDEGKGLVKKVVVSSEGDAARGDAARTSIVRRLQELGCSAIATPRQPPTGS